MKPGFRSVLFTFRCSEQCLTHSRFRQGSCHGAGAAEQTGQELAWPGGPSFCSNVDAVKVLESDR